MTPLQPIPFLDLCAQHAPLAGEILDRLGAIVRGAGFVGGPEVEGFETEFAAYCQAGHCAGVASGTDALRFAFMALGVEPGDEIITVPQTFIATAEAILQSGGSVRFVDVDPVTHTLDPAQLAGVIGPRTVGIVPVHLYGRPADMDPILEIARRHGLWVVEDAAQAHGARYRGRTVGTLADVACFSFYPGKNLGACGEAGAVVSRDPDLIARVRVIRDHGQREKYVHDVVGYNGRLDAMQAAILRIKLSHLAAWTSARRVAAGWYGELLADVPGLEIPLEPAYAESVYHLYAVQAADRERLRVQLAAEGIGTGLHYPVPLHLQEAFAPMGIGAGAFPVAERVAAQTLSLPMFPELTRAQVARVADAVRRAVAAWPSLTMSG